MEKVLSPDPGDHATGKETILLGTYNYMGMTFDPDVIAAGKQALDEFGSGTTGSRVLNGTYQGHKEVRGGAARNSTAWTTPWSSRPATRPISASSPRIAGKGDYIILDIDSHASIYDGCALGNAEIVPLPPQRRRGARQAPRPRMPAEAPASWSCSKASIRCSATSRR